LKRKLISYQGNDTQYTLKKNRTSRWTDDEGSSSCRNVNKNNNKKL